MSRRFSSFHLRFRRCITTKRRSKKRRDKRNIVSHRLHSQARVVCAAMRNETEKNVQFSFLIHFFPFIVSAHNWNMSVAVAHIPCRHVHNVDFHWQYNEHRRLFAHPFVRHHHCRRWFYQIHDRPIDVVRSPTNLWIEFADRNVLRFVQHQGHASPTISHQRHRNQPSLLLLLPLTHSLMCQSPILWKIDETKRRNKKWDILLLSLAPLRLLLIMLYAHWSRWQKELTWENCNHND